MANFRDSIEMKVIIQGTEAINELGKLEAEAKDLRLSLKDIAKENEGFKQLEVSAKNLDKQYAKLDETLKHHTATQALNKQRSIEANEALSELNLSGSKDIATIKQLTKDRDYYNKMVESSTRHIESTTFRLTQNREEMEKVQAELKTTAKETQEYIDTNEKIKNAQTRIQELREEYGLSAMTMRQLRKYQGELNTEIDNVTYGTEAYKDLKTKIQEVSNTIQNQKADLKASTQDFKALVASVGLAGMTIEQLGDYQKELNQELKGVVFGTDAYKNLKTNIQEVNNAIENQQNDLKASTQDFKALRAAVGLAGMTIEQLGDYQKELNQELKGVVFGTDAYKKLKNNIQEVSTAIQNQQNDLRDTRTGWQKFKDEIRGFGVATLGNIGGEIAMRAFDGMTQALVGTVTQAAKLSDELADIQRFTGSTAEETKKLNAELSALNTRTSTADLREIVMVGGQLGVEKDEILGFVKAIDQANVALSKEFGGNAEAVANSLGKLKNIFAETKNMNWEEAMSRISSAIIAAGASSSASAPQIADFTQRIGAIGELGPKLTESLGIGAALIDLGLSSEIASSGLQALFITAGKESDNFAKQMGISVEQFKKLQNESPNKMLIELAKSFKGLDNDQVLAGLQRMGISSGETVKVMALLKDNTDKVVSSQAKMRDEFDTNTKAQDAFNLKMTTFGAQVDLAKKEINGLVAGLTSALLPVMTKIVEKTVAFVIILKELPKFLDDNKVAIGALVVALLTFNVSAIIANKNIISMNFNLLTMQVTMRSLSVVIGIVNFATKALNLTMSLNPIGLVITAVALLVAGLGYLYNNSETVRNGINGIAKAFVEVGKIVIDFAKTIATLGLSQAFDGLIGSWDRVKKAFAEGATPVINEPVGNKLLTPQAKKEQQLQKMEEYAPFFESREKPKVAQKQSQFETISYEDAATIAENKKRAEELAAADKAEADKKDAAARERANKRKEDRLKAEREANEAIAALRVELNKDEEQKEIAQAKLANAKSLEKYQELFAKKMISKQQFDEIEKLQQETLQQKLFEIDNKWRAKTAEEIAAANKKSFEEKLKNLENDKVLDDAQAALKDINAQADTADKFANATPELQDAALADLDYLQKQAALDREEEFLQKKLELYRKYGMLTKDMEVSLKEQEADNLTKKIDFEIAEKKRKKKEEEELRKKENDKIKEGLTQIGSAAGSIANSLEQLGIKNSAFGKALALTQIAVSTGLALAKSIPLAIEAASMSGPAAPFVFAGHLATITATVLGGIAQAKSVVESAPTPTASAKSPESNTNSPSTSGYVVGGYTGEGNIYEVAGVVHKGEYVIPAHLLKVPQIANFAGMVEAVRTNKQGYIQGGLVDNNNTQKIIASTNTNANAEITQNLMLVVQNLANQVQNLQQKPMLVKSYVVARDMSEIQDNEDNLDNEIKM